MKTIAMVNLKGGVGKTVTAVNLSVILAKVYHQRVLLVDTDGQASATGMLLTSGGHRGLTALLRKEERFYGNLTAPSGTENLDILPADSGLWDLGPACAADGSLLALRDLRNAAVKGDAYDVIIIDCPPSFSVPCVAGILASDGIVIPVLPDGFSAENMDKLKVQIDRVQKIQPEARTVGCLINQYRGADVVSDAVNYLREESPIPVFDTVIRRTDKVLETTWAKEPLLMWAPYSSAARDYLAFTEELIRKNMLEAVAAANAHTDKKAAPPKWDRRGFSRKCR